MRQRGEALKYAILGIMSLPLVGMYTWLVMNSVSGGVVYGLLPTKFSLSNWRFLTGPFPFNIGGIKSVWSATVNSLIVGTGVALVTASVCSLAGYALSRLSFTGRTAILQVLLALRAFPMLILLIATYFILYYLGLLDTFLSVILARSAINLAFCTWVIKGFFDDVPKEVEEAAMVDGATRFQIWTRIMLPLIKPGLVTVLILGFRDGWSDFIFTNTFIFSEAKWTLSMLIYTIVNNPESMDYGLLAALSVYFMVPAMALYIIGQRGFTQASMGGAER